METAPQLTTSAVEITGLPTPILSPIKREDASFKNKIFRASAGPLEPHLPSTLTFRASLSTRGLVTVSWHPHHGAFKVAARSHSDPFSKDSSRQLYSRYQNSKCILSSTIWPGM